MSGALVVFAKAPRPGEVKTRLCPPFTPEQAAELYACLLDDVLTCSAQAARELGLAALLAVHPADAVEELARRAPAPFRAIPQLGANLAQRMQNAASVAAAAGYAPLLLRGSDSPILDVATLAEALAALARADLAICPDPDGGYGLVALRAPVSGLFDHPMSTDRVLENTLANARALGLRAELLAPGFDIDTPADLARLAEARRAGRTGPCPRTLAWLDRGSHWNAPGTR